MFADGSMSAVQCSSWLVCWDRGNSSSSFSWSGNAPRGPTPEEERETYRQWLDQRISRRRSPELYAYFERVCHFALSVDLEDVLYPEIVETTKNMFRYGAPGIVDGGCATLTRELERRVRESGGRLRLQQDVLAITSRDGIVTGVRIRERETGEEALLRAPLVISTIGPEATRRMAAESTLEVMAGSYHGHRYAGAGHPAAAGLPPPDVPLAPSGKREASGLKVHLLCDESIIPHRGIMYCLDTARIAGIVQPSNSDARLAPPGKHLLITHQLLQSENMQAERDAARADLLYLFGDDLGNKVKILTMSQYRGEWPVNRAAQGADVPPETGLVGLYLAGDAVKPSGYLMVEGVAQSVNTLMDLVDPVGTAAGRHVPSKPNKRRAFHWLVAPPPPHPGS